MKIVTIVILNFNGQKDTVECLKSIDRLKATNYKLKVVVVDNGSTNKFKIQFSGFAWGENSKFKDDELKIIRNDYNLGFAGGNNVGIKHSLEQGADYVLVLNNDTIVDENLLEQLLKAAKEDPEIGIIAPKIYFAKGYEFHKDKYTDLEKGKVIWYAGGVMDWKNVLGRHRGVDAVDIGQFNKSGLTEFASGCCMFVKREVFLKVGFFDEKYFLYYEDSDFCLRAKKMGYKIWFTSSALLWHKNAGSAGGSGSTLQDYYITRNRMLFGIKYAPFRLKFALLRESIFLLFQGRDWQKRGILDFYLNRFGRGSYTI